VAVAIAHVGRNRFGALHNVWVVSVYDDLRFAVM
jgi:hypothetical protein